jgi:nucleoside-diphosphate-sugar epimerase
MPHTLVTGANSFVAAHIINELISNRHTVTGIVRRTSAGDELLAENPDWVGKVDFVTVEDYAKEGAFDAIFQSRECNHVVHVAAPLPGSAATDYDVDFLRPGVQGNLALLKGVKAYGKTVKSIVFTGSICSIATGAPDDNRKRVYTNESWNEITPEFAREYTAYRPDYIKYCSSKKEAEFAIWDFVKTEKPDFNVSYCPLVHEQCRISSLHCSIQIPSSSDSGTMYS